MKTNILVVKAGLCSLLLTFCAGAQQTEKPGVLQLEATIRGNKELPKVLSIVPWQLPQHRAIHQPDLGQTQLMTFPFIERGQLTRQLRLREKMLVETKSSKASEPGVD